MLQTSDLPGAEENSVNIDTSSSMRNLYSGDGVPPMDPMDNRSSPTPSIARYTNSRSGRI